MANIRINQHGDSARNAPTGHYPILHHEVKIGDIPWCCHEKNQHFKKADLLTPYR
jgi:hypothetical protein